MSDQIHTKEEVFQILRMISGSQALSQRKISSELGFSLERGEKVDVCSYFSMSLNLVVAKL